MSLMIFGCGYLGQRVADQWSATGREVHVVTRSPQRAEQMQHRGWHALVADPVRRGTLTDLPCTDYVLFAVGFDRSSQLSISDVFVGGLKNVLACTDPSVQRFVYISSTGVYGQSDGAWVDEDSSCTPQREGGKACLAAEQHLQTHPLGSRSNILRLAGLYGPGRIPRQVELQAGNPIAVPTRGFLNLIHVDDAAAIVINVMLNARPGRTYLVSDGHPVPRGQYFDELARLMGAPAPTFVEPDPDSSARQRAAGNKRVRNRRLMDEIPVTLRYPSFREGLAAILAAQT